MMVAKGFAQQPGIDYGETFPLVVGMDRVRLVLSIVAQKEWPIYQLDFKSSFLNGVLEEEVYVE